MIIALMAVIVKMKIRFPDAPSGEYQDYIKGQPFTLPEA